MSLVNSRNLDVNKSELEIFVNADIFKDACKRVYLKEVKRLNIPGFRKGKAPKKVIEKMYGDDVFFNGAMDLVCPKAIDDAVVESGLEVVGLEKIETVEVSEQKGFTFKATLILKPEVKIENYKGIKIECEAAFVDETMVKQQIEKLRQRAGRLVSVDGRASKNGDVVLIDYDGFVDGKKFSGGSAKNFSLKLGSGQFIEGFEEQVVGHNVGDEFEISVVFPKNYHVEELKGKSVNFNCKLNEIKVLEFPKLDDDFAKEVSKFDTLKELKNDINVKLQKRVERRKQEQIDSQILEFLAKNVDVQIPQIMIDEKTDDFAKNFEDRLSLQGLSLNQYLSSVGTSGYDLKNNFSTQAEFKIRTDLALEKIAKLEKIELQDSDFDVERKKIAELYRVDLEKIKKLFPNERLKSSLIVRKALDWLRSNSKVSEISKQSKVKELDKQKSVIKKSATSKSSDKNSNVKKVSKTVSSKRSVVKKNNSKTASSTRRVAKKVSTVKTESKSSRLKLRNSKSVKSDSN